MTLKAPLIALFLLTACADFPSADFQRAMAPSLSTEWTEANVRYNKTQRRAVEYAQRCDRDHDLFLSACRSVVDDLHDYDQLALDVQNEGYAAVGRQDAKGVASAIRDLDGVASEMNQLLPEETVR